jgi:hypothetical protein
MAKSSQDKKLHMDQLLDLIDDLDQMELFDLCDPSDHIFWEEFFRIEEVLELTDELDPPTFSVSIRNDRTGETKTYNKIRLQSVRKKIVC